MGVKLLRKMLMEKFLSLKKIILEIFCIGFMVYIYLFVLGASDQGFIVHLFKLF